MRLERAVLAAVLGLALASPSAAQVTVGTANGNNCYPFACINSDGRTRYQQVYGASAFGSALSFNTLTFFNSQHAGAAIQSGNYLIRFATVGLGPDGLTSNADFNLGGSPQTFFSGALGSGGLSITGNTLTYDPSQGHLLMDVTVTGQTAGYGNWLDASYSGGDQMSRYYGNATGGMDSAGLVTQFSNTNVTPEPVSMALLGTGLAGLGAVRRRRRQPVEQA